jgi:peptidyl-prolyl cis-trans isomerase SurA
MGTSGSGLRRPDLNMLNVNQLIRAVAVTVSGSLRSHPELAITYWRVTSMRKTLGQPLSTRLLTRAATASALAALLMVPLAGHMPVFGQAQGLPGLVVSPPSGPAAAPSPGIPGLMISTPPPAAAPAPPVAAAPAPKPKPKAAAKPVTKTGSIEKSGAGTASGQSIVVLVNDDPITGYQVEQRQRLNALSANIGEKASANMKALVQSEGTQTRFRAMIEEIVKQNQATKSRDQIMAMIEVKKKEFGATLQKQALESARASVLPGMKKEALDELVEERLKLQEAKRLGVTADDAQVDTILKSLAERNKMDLDQFGKHLATMGADIKSMRERFRATLSWNDVVRRKFSHEVVINQSEVDRFVATAGSSGDDEVELKLQRFTLSMPAKFDQKSLAQRLDDAEKLRQDFKGCATGQVTAAKTVNTRFEDLGVKKAATIPEPTRSLLLNAKAGEIVPPNVAKAGVEVYALCDRSVVKAADKKRDEYADNLKQKEFEVKARRLLRDLCQDTHIEYRDGGGSPTRTCSKI